MQSQARCLSESLAAYLRALPIRGFGFITDAVGGMRESLTGD